MKTMKKSPFKPQTRSIALYALSAALLSGAALLFAETPPWERLMEPTEPDTEAIKKAAETPKTRPAESEPAPQPVVLDKKEQEKREKEKRELEKKEQEKKEQEKKAQEKERKALEKKEKERLRKEKKEQEKREKEKRAQEKKAGGAKTAAPAPAPAAETPTQPAPAAGPREWTPPPAESKKQPEPAKPGAPAAKPAEPAKAEAQPPKPTEPAKPAGQADDDDDDDAKTKPAGQAKTEAPAKSEGLTKTPEAAKPAETPKTAAPAKPAEPAKAETPPKPAEPVKTETPPKPAEPAKAETPPKPAEPAKAEAQPKPAEPAKVEAPPKPAEPAKAETPPKPAEPAKAEAQPKPAEPAKAEAPPKPAEPAKAGAQPKPAEPAKAEAQPKPVEEPAAAEKIAERETFGDEGGRRGDKPAGGTAGAVFETSGSRIGVRASIGIGGLWGHEPVGINGVLVFARPGDPGAFTVPDPDAQPGDPPIYKKYAYDEIELGTSLSGGVSLVLLSRINDRLGLSCELQYSFYVASGEAGKPEDVASFWPVSGATVELHSLEVPVLLRINAGASLGYPVYAEVGPLFGFNMYAIKTDYADGSLKISKPSLNVLTLGPVVGAGFEFDRVSVGLRLYLGLLEYVKQEGGRPWSLTLGVTSFF